MNLSKIKFKESNSWIVLLDLIFPINIVICRFDETSPSNLYGGTWVQLNTTTTPKLIAPGTSGSWTQTATFVVTPTTVTLSQATLGFPGKSLTLGTGSWVHNHLYEDYVTGSSEYKMENIHNVGGSYINKYKITTAGVSNGYTVYTTTCATVSNNYLTTISTSDNATVTHNHKYRYTDEDGYIFTTNNINNVNNYIIKNSNGIFSSTASSTTTIGHQHSYTNTSVTITGTPAYVTCHMWQRQS